MGVLDFRREEEETRAAIDRLDAAQGQVPIVDEDGKPRKQSDILVDIGRQHELFHDPGNDAFTKIRIGLHYEVHAIASTEYRELLSEQFLEIVGKGCNRNALGDAVTTLAALAKFRGEEIPTWLRVGESGDDIIIDTGDKAWNVIRVNASGWRAEPGGNVMMRRAGKSLALPQPSKANFGLLWRYLNIKEEDRVLIAAFMLGAFRPGKPYAPILLSGEQGTGKSTFTRLLKAIIDPSASPLRAPPKDTRDLLVGARNSWLLCLDNLSYMPPQLSDAMCRLSTGGSISERTLYSNLDETLVEVMRPAILNGIEELASRPDLAQRGIHIELEPIKNRRSESEMWKSFNRDAPAILAGLLDGVSMALRDVDTIDIKLPRMADFALWAEAGLPALGFERGQFSEAYGRNQIEGMSMGLESSPAGQAITALMQNRGRDWTGTLSDLLAAISEYATDDSLRSKAWPKSARGMRAIINRLGPALRNEGIEIEYTRNEKCRLVTLIVQGGF